MIQQNQKKPVQILKIAKLLAFFTFFGLIIWGLIRLDSADFLQINISWEIDMSAPIDKAEIIAKIQPLIANKYNLPLNQIKQTLQGQDWVETVQIKRLFWNTILITITAKKVYLRWKIAGICPKKQKCNGYISTQNELFTPKKMIDSNAIQVSTKNKDAKSILKIVQDYHHYQRLISPMKIKSMRRNNIDTLILHPNITLVLGHNMQTQHLLNFKKIYKIKKSPRLDKGATFDMRYPQGFSLKYH